MSEQPEQAPNRPARSGDVSGTSVLDPDDVAGAVDPAGHFRIYLGAAPGVGKTYAMLDEGHRRLLRGTDLVIGYVESHGRIHTIDRIGNLEVVPRKTVCYRGTTLEEMDVDAVIARHPKVALVDELAHTNAPETGRHLKRWQDVLDILEAGIDVISTVNIQHLESIAELVEKITGVRVRERVPDWVVRRADQIELIDSSPEQLRRRMLHGNIYPMSKVPQALNHFFRIDNLAALRELALRYLADEAEEDLMRHLRAHHIDGTWETTERIMFIATDEDATEEMIHRAARLASRTKAPLEVVHLRRGDPTTAGAQRVATLREISVSVGARWNEVVSDCWVKALMDFAKENQITQIVIGVDPTDNRVAGLGARLRLRRLQRISTSAGIDVHVIASATHP